MVYGVEEKILFIAPNKEMGGLALEVASNLDINLEVQVSYMEDSIPHVIRAKEQGINFFIARGSTAAIIKEECNVHVIELYQNNIEILRAIHKAARFGSNIALVWYNQIPYNEDLLYNLLQIDVHLYCYQSKKDIEDIMSSLKKEKTEVVIGGIYTISYAEKLGIKGVLVECDEQSMHWTMNYAKEIINIVKNEEIKRKKTESIVENVHDGIIAIDSRNVVSIFNPAAEKILGIKAKDIIDKSIDECSSVNKLYSLFNGGDQLSQIIDLKTAKISANRLKLTFKEELVGTVITFQDITKIKQLEQSIRQRLYSKGHIAKYVFEDILGNNPLLLRAISIAKKYSITDETILLIGKSGTGKEMFAQSIHNNSNRKDGPFVAVNCAEFPETLFESELFGYEEGAFTGAKKGGKDGLFALAHNGTIFLDEISEIPLHLQTSILRVIQEKIIRPVGSDQIIPIDVRIIAASNKDLYDLVLQNKFRMDLYYRINVLNVRIPPLCDRIDDIPIIINALISKSGHRIKFTQSAINLLGEYKWPGNVRELINLVRRIIIIYNEGTLDHENLIQIMPEFNLSLNNNIYNTSKTLVEIEREAIIEAMKKYEGNQTRVASELGVSRTFIWKKLKEINY